MKKICFVMTEAYPIISGKGQHIGGAEFQSWLIGKELVKNGFKVFFIVRAPENGIEIFDNVIIFKIKYKNPVIGYIKMLKAMIKINADIYYQRTGGFATVFVCFFCKIFKKGFVFHVSRDEQLDKGYPYDKHIFIKKFYETAVNLADTIIVQNKTQMKKISYKRPFLIPNVIEVYNIVPKKENFVLWVASITGVKRPELFIKLAKKLPEYKFVMIGNASDEKLYENIRKKSKEIKNLKFLGFKPFKEADGYFKKAKIFVNTSSLEGFPNTFLQAWRYGTPVVSLDIDPDEIICKYKLGFHSKVFDNMVKHIKLLMENEKLRKELGKNGRKYVEKNHNIKKIINEYIKIFEKN
ncbi:MAG: hypothetical protein DRP13_01065 [Candidatus Aenigmatarchaeota archaeon]|nr:MAG: hypothetical protein DRP13_01065 [Candidatus Aenigmarchaeota archaeon]